jgi:hypothetical protein
MKHTSKDYRLLVRVRSQSKQMDGEGKEGKKEGRYEQMTPTVNRCGSTAEAIQRLFTLQDISLLHYNRMAASEV